MNKLFFVFLVALMVIGCIAANAAIYTFTPTDSDLGDLPHGNFYTWGIQWVMPATEVITGATLTYKDIYDTEHDIKSRLYTHLLDSVVDPNAANRAPNYVNGVGTGGYSYKTITITKTDADGGGDNFAGQGVLLGTFASQTKQTLVYNVDPAQFAWLTDGNFGFGIDPDCHYYNCGVQFKITTATAPPPGPGPTVPEPMSIMLGIMGLGSVVGLKRFRR